MENAFFMSILDDIGRTSWLYLALKHINHRLIDVVKVDIVHGFVRRFIDTFILVFACFMAMFWLSLHFFRVFAMCMFISRMNS